MFCGVGMVRAEADIALTNIVYKMCRVDWCRLKRNQPNLIKMKKGVMNKINVFFFHWVILFYASKKP